MAGSRAFCIFSTLPPECLARVLAFDSESIGEIRRHGLVCREQREAIKPESEFWLGLARFHFGASAEEARAWGGETAALALYEDLAFWAPRQGVYTIAGGFPWGCLAVVRIAEGDVCGEVIRWVPKSGSWTYDGPFDRSRSGFRETATPFFRGRLGSGRAAAACGAYDWLHPRDVTADDLDPLELRVRLNHAEPLFEVREGAPLYDCARALRFRAPAGGAPPASLASAVEEAMDLFWAPDPRPARLDASLRSHDAQAVGLVAELFAKCGSCDVALVRSPAAARDTAPLAESLRSGLYVGDYGARYGRFRTEVLLVETVALTKADALRDLGPDVAPQARRLFTRPKWCASDDAADLALPSEIWTEALYDLPETTTLTFIKATKVCGDLYVPMGSVTFCALVDPPEAVDALRASVSEPPVVVVDRQTSANEPVSRAWPGLGALAFIGFNHFSVSPGDLVRLADAPDGTHRFGFCWQRDQDAIILHWIAAQESAKYLQAP